jgi:hypothetical protein
MPLHWRRCCPRHADAVRRIYGGGDGGNSLLGGWGNGPVLSMC